MDEFVAVIIAIWVVASTVISGQFLVMDYRNFDIVKQQCTSQGYIQNNTIRINCSLEERK